MANGINAENDSKAGVQMQGEFVGGIDEAL